MAGKDSEGHEDFMPSGKNPRLVGACILHWRRYVCTCDLRSAKFCWSRSRAQRCLGHYVNLDCSSGVDEQSSSTRCAAAAAGRTCSSAVSVSAAQSLQRHASSTSFDTESPITEYQYLYVRARCMRSVAIVIIFSVLVVYYCA